jgi:2-polyprenyl-3-methyl-5-hydroxy-6-metoxy-1,4-benzoquinol methylase
MKQKIRGLLLHLIHSLDQRGFKLFYLLFNSPNSLLNSKGVKMKYIKNVKDLDVEFQKVDEKFAISHDEGMQSLNEFCYVFDGVLPEDPYSKEYFDAQMQLYLHISGKDNYTVDNEHVEFDYEGLKNNPYPYYTKSPYAVGDQLIAQGFLIKIMNLKPNARIVEFGPGWGNTTLHFAQMDYEVTAVDSEHSFIELIKYRTEMLSKKVELAHKDMLDFSSSTKYDAAVFFECFHHCADHLKLIKNLHNLINDDGLIAFAAEPIADAPYFPYPWGVRLEGMSVWSIRKFGWLELGFDTSYFMRTLLLLGWTPRRYRSDASPIADVIIAKKSHMYYEPGEITLPPDECKTWAIKETDPTIKLRFTQSKSVMSCAKDIKAKFVEFCLSNYAPFSLEVKLTAGRATKTFKIPKSSVKGMYKIPIQDWNGQITISSKTWKPSKVWRNGDPRELGVAVHYFRFVN